MSDDLLQQAFRDMAKATAHMAGAAAKPDTNNRVACLQAAALGLIALSVATVVTRWQAGPTTVVNNGPKTG